MADEFDLEQEVARLRGKLKALTVITVLFMLTSGGLAAAVYMKVSKKPAAVDRIKVEKDGATTLIMPGMITLTTQGAGLEVSPRVLSMSAEGHRFEVRPGRLEVLSEDAKERVELSVVGPTPTQVALHSDRAPPRVELTHKAQTSTVDPALVSKVHEPPAPAPAPAPVPVPGQPGAPAGPP